MNPSIDECSCTVAISVSSHKQYTRLVSSYLDFPALFRQSCRTTGRYLRSDAYLCDVTISPTLATNFPGIFGDYTSQHMHSTCAWNPFSIDVLYDEPKSNVYYNEKLIPTQEYTTLPLGYCALSGPENPNADSSIATGMFASNPVKGYFATDLADTGCRNYDCCVCACNKGVTECKQGPDKFLNFNVQGMSNNNDGGVRRALQCSDTSAQPLTLKFAKQQT